MGVLEGEAVIRGCRFEGNEAESGGGLSGRNCAIVVEECLFRENVVSLAGGGMHSSGKGASLSIESTTACANMPDQIAGEWIDLGGNWISDLTSFAVGVVWSLLGLNARYAATYMCAGTTAT